MSVFQSIKGTFAAGLKSFTSRDQSKDDQVKYTKSGVNVDTGAELLHKYQLIWKELHEQAEENARCAEDVDGLITSLYVDYDRQCETLNKLHDTVAELPVILTQLQDLTDVLANLEEEYDKVEAAMLRLENVTEEQEFEKTRALHVQKLSQYDLGKRQEYEKIKGQLAKEHAKSMQQFDKVHQTHLKERQDTFQEKFDEDVNYFKTYGHIHADRLSTGSGDSGKKPDLSEIEIEEDDHDKLDEFLATADADSFNENLVSTHDGVDEVFNEEDITNLMIKSDEDFESANDIPNDNADIDSDLNEENVQSEVSDTN